MAKSGGMRSGSYVPGVYKKSRQGNGARTKYSASSRNGPKKKYRGQGKH